MTKSYIRVTSQSFQRLVRFARRGAFSFVDTMADLMMNLSDSGLFRDQCFVNGDWVGADDGATLDVTNPADGAVIGTVPRLGAPETRRAIDAAQAALPAWRAKTARQRAVILRRLTALMMDHQDDLGVLMTTEQGKPLAEAKGEIGFAASFFEWYAEEGQRVYGDIIPTHKADARIIVTKEPVGVVGAITPWNFPAGMIARKAAPALAVGCTIVIKPASSTPYSALALAELAKRAGVPAGVFNVITGSAAAIAGELSSNPIVRKMTFTGSTEIGRQLLAQCATTIKKVSMELGGNAPFIVFDDADLDAAVDGAIISKYRNTGQTCVCANRVLVQAGVYDAFTAKYVAKVKALKVGNGLEAGVAQGPLIDEAACVKVQELIDDAVAKGAKVVCGGGRHQLGGTFFQPTVLTNMTRDMAVSRDETFGPMAPLYKFETEDEAIAMANDTEFGLAAYFYTRDVGRVFRVGEALEYGLIGANEGLVSTAVAPFGGFKESGLGREGSKYGIEDYLEIKYMLVGGI